MSDLQCRSCGASLQTSFADLGMQPVSNRFRKPAQWATPEVFFPLRAYACDACTLVQLQDFGSASDHFNEDYVYFSSFSSSWLDHAERYAGQMIARFALSSQSRVVEIASNDGYLLQNFVKAGIPCLGVDPAANCAAAAQSNGVRTHVGFFGAETARYLADREGQADLIVANNVLAHVPDINDFVAGFALLLKPEGVATFEFPHLGALMRETQFDTIYHEHYSYLSLNALQPLFARHGLEIFDAERLQTHGGSLRVFVGFSGAHPLCGGVAEVASSERAQGLDRIETYAAFGLKVAALKRRILTLLIGLKEQGLTIAGYGAPAKGNTLLNYCGIGRDMLDFTVDRNPAKQGLFLPGTGIAVEAVETIAARRPDCVLILPWNLRQEIVAELAFIGDWGGRFVVAIPEPRIIASGEA